MFGPPGVAYVYLVYGMYHCLNVVTEPEGRAAAILIRAAEPVSGLGAMRHARLAGEPRGRVAATAISDRRLASGPGVLCRAMSITRLDTGRDLLDPSSPLRLELADAALPAERVATGPRVGIDYAPEPWRSIAWRFADAASPSLSRPVPPRA